MKLNLLLAGLCAGFCALATTACEEDEHTIIIHDWDGGPEEEFDLSCDVVCDLVYNYCFDSDDWSGNWNTCFTSGCDDGVYKKNEIEAYAKSLYDLTMDSCNRALAFAGYSRKTENHKHDDQDYEDYEDYEDYDW